MGLVRIHGLDALSLAWCSLSIFFGLDIGFARKS